jgi:hypothetical protein
MKEHEVGKTCRAHVRQEVDNILVGTPEEQSPLWRLGRTWMQNKRMNHKERVYEGVDWIQLTQDRTSDGLL